MGLDLEHPGRRERLFWPALISILILFSGTMLYPDTFTDVKEHIGPFKVSAVGILFILAAPVVTVYFWRNRHDIRFRGLDALLIATITFVTARGMAAQNSLNGMALVGAFAGYSLLLYYGMAVLGQRRIAPRILVLSFAAIGIVVALYAIVEFVFNKDFLFGEITREKARIKNADFRRSGSTLAHPVLLGAFMVQTLPFVACLFFKARSAAGRLAWGLAFTAVAVALFVSFSKGNFVAILIIAAGIAFWLLKKEFKLHKKTILWLTLSSVVIVAIVSLLFPDAIGFNLFSGERKAESIDLRVYSWRLVPQALEAKPLFGTGLWQGISDIEVPPGVPSTVDNQYLSILVEEGLVGSILLGASFILIARQAWQLLRGGKKSARWALPVAISMSAFAISGLFSNILFEWPMIVVFWLEAGLLRALFEVSYQELTETQQLAPALQE